jgi:hypothetical protein
VRLGAGCRCAAPKEKAALLKGGFFLRNFFLQTPITIGSGTNRIEKGIILDETKAMKIQHEVKQNGSMELQRELEKILSSDCSLEQLPWRWLKPGRKVLG